MGMGLKRQITDAFKGRKIAIEAFNGSSGPDNPHELYLGAGEVDKAKSNAETFANLRAQRYVILADRMRRTYQAVEHGEYHNPEELISFSSSIKCIQQLKSELCRIPRKYVPSGKVQILSKPEMKALKIKSPNLADCVMMGADAIRPSNEVPIEMPTTRAVWR